MKKQDKDIHIRIDSGLLSSFREYASNVGVSQSDLLRAFIVALVKGQFNRPTVIKFIEEG